MSTINNNWHEVVKVGEGASSDSKVDRVQAYDDNANIYDDDMAALDYQSPSVAANAVHHILKGKTDARILDVGCGTGLFVKEMRKLAPYNNIDGVEPANKMLSLALENGLYSNGFNQYFHCNSDFDSDSYDAVISVAAFVPDHISAEAIKEMVTIAKPGGIVMITMRAAWLVEDGDLSKLRPYIHEMVSAGRVRVIEDREFDNHWANTKGQLFLLEKL